MAHIASCLAEAESGALSSKPVSPQVQNETVSSPSWNSWRMQQPQSENRKYQLFPKAGPLPQLYTGKGIGPEEAFAIAMGQPTAQAQQSPKLPVDGAPKAVQPQTMSNNDKPAEKSERPRGAELLRLKIREHGLMRRRKVSVPELGPMTTVQEAAMDSPTIPGRPPLHERSISAPGSGYKPNELLPSAGFFFVDRLVDEIPEVDSPLRPAAPSPRPEGYYNRQHHHPPATPGGLLKLPLSPKRLPPLVIPLAQQPAAASARLDRQLSITRKKSGSNPVEISSRSAVRNDESPRAKGSSSGSGPCLFSPHALLFTPRSAAASSAVTASTLPTPVSATVPELRSSPKIRDRGTTVNATMGPAGSSPASYATNEGSTASTAEATMMTTHTAAALSFFHPSAPWHRRGQSESSSIMERGRPRNRADKRVGAPVRRTDSKRTKSADRKAFEELPQGYKTSEAASKLTPAEVEALYTQAHDQALRFEVLRPDDVETLSRELRQLDERTEYLRRTYTSLRAGRRNLHSRICQHLRSPCVTRFSSESMLQQEEALAELDASIDDWVNKLEQAENRRTRVRQKLLEHVAAAATLNVANLPSPAPDAAAISDSFHHIIGAWSSPPPPPPPCTMIARDYSSPPRSPNKPIFPHHRVHGADSTSPSPQRVVAQVPSTIFEHPPIENVATGGASINGEAQKRRDVESIRIYADSDVYALLADVEQEITKMSAIRSPTAEEQSAGVAELELNKLRDIHRAQSHELLVGQGTVTVTATATAASGTSDSLATTTDTTTAPAAAAAVSNTSDVPGTVGIASPPITFGNINKSTPKSPPPPSPPSKNSLQEEQLILLTKAVFKPERPMITA